MKISKEELQQLASSLQFSLDDNQLNDLVHESEILISKLEDLSYIQVDWLEPMYYPIADTKSTLREDVAIKVNDPNSYIKNAKNRKDKYVVVK